MPQAPHLAYALLAFAVGITVLFSIRIGLMRLVDNLEPFDDAHRRPRAPITPIIDPMGSPAEE
jgi:hypothetical protein